MKIKNENIENLFKAIQKIMNNHYLNFSKIMAILKLHNELKICFDTLNIAKNNLLKKYGTKENESSTRYAISGSNITIYANDYNELLNTEIDINVDDIIKFTIDDLKNMKEIDNTITALDIQSLMLLGNLNG